MPHTYIHICPSKKKKLNRLVKYNTINKEGVYCCTKSNFMEFTTNKIPAT